MCVDRLKLAAFQSDADLTEHGYPPVEPLRGCDLRSPGYMEDEAADVLLAVVPARRAPFRHMPAEERKAKRERCERVLRDQFPGVNLPLLRLLIAAKGFAQRRPIEPPMIMLTGQSCAGKTATVLLAAELACDTADISRLNGNLQEFLMAVGTACGRHGFLLLDEITKVKASAGELEAGLLSIKRGAQYRQLHVGYRPFGVLPVLVMADTVLPGVMQTSVQLARRIVRVDLGAGSNVGADWRTTCHGGEIVGWRARWQDNTEAADWLVSDVLAESMNCTTFHEAAEVLGFSTLNKAGADGIDPNAELRELFEAACDAPDATGGHWKGKGWKVFDQQGDGTALAKAWAACLDPDDPTNVQRISGSQWGTILGQPGIVLDVQRHGRKVGLRFRVGDLRSEDAVYNREIFPGQQAPEPPDTLPMVEPGLLSVLAAVPQPPVAVGG